MISYHIDSLLYVGRYKAAKRIGYMFPSSFAADKLFIENKIKNKTKNEYLWHLGMTPQRSSSLRSQRVTGLGCQLGALYVPTHQILGTIISLRSHVVTNITIRNNTIIDVVDDHVIF